MNVVLDWTLLLILYLRFIRNGAGTIKNKNNADKFLKTIASLT